jgi:DNA (cytosine-5)-methyltransferase 1
MHLFAGAGGGLLADLILGHTPVVAVEWEPYPCQVLRERAAEGWFPELRVWEGDVRLFDPSEYTGQVDCIHAGFPCQDISVAGKQAGVGEGTRSGLYREVLRIAGAVRPRYIFLENVAAIKSNGLEQVVKDLAIMGYDTRWLCIRASDVGAPHHRDRWFSLSDSGKFGRYNGGHNREERHVYGNQEWNVEKIQPERNERKHRVGEVCEILADTEHNGFTTSKEQHCGDKQNARGSKKSDCFKQSAGSNTQSCISTNVADSNSTQCEGNERTKRVQQEYTDIISASWWQTEPNVGRVVDGMAARVDKLKAIGNGQVPLQVATAFTILAAE